MEFASVLRFGNSLCDVDTAYNHGKDKWMDDLKIFVPIIKSNTRSAWFLAWSPPSGRTEPA